MWHRRDRDTDRTACALTIGGAFASRDYELDADLCGECFTRHERDTGEIDRALLEHATETGALYFDPDDDPTDRIELPRAWVVKG